MKPLPTGSSLCVRPWLLAAMLGCGGGAAQAQEPSVPGSGWPGDAAWSRWQGRIGLADAAGDLAAAGRSAAPRSSLSLLGDYYFTQRGLSAQDSYGGGFRATGGLFVGPRSGLWLATPASLSALSTGIVAQRRGVGWLTPSTPETFDGGSAPYVGVGYTGLKSLRATGGGWGFSADVGVVALQPRSLVRLGPQGLGETQLGALLQVGVSYSF